MLVRCQRALDLSGAVVLCAIGQLEVWTGVRVGGIGRLPADPPRAILALLVAAVTLPLVWRRRSPVPVAIAVVAILFVQTTWVPAVSLIAGLLPLLVVTFTVAASGRPRWRPVGLVFGLAGQTAFVVGIPEERVPGEVAFGVFVIAGCWLLGMLVGRRLDQAEDSVANAAARLQTVIEDERARIARELHDVIAHGVSVMGVQAAVARVQLESDIPSARATLRAVEQQAREAIDELQRLLGVLRGAPELSQEPQPGLARVPALGEAMRAAGMPVTITVQGVARRLAAGADLAAYRLIQEALTNTLKHAGTVPTTVTLTWDAQVLRIEVDDAGVVASRKIQPGHGLVGMRERVDLYGGALEARAKAGGGFRVCATLPVGPLPRTTASGDLLSADRVGQARS